MTAAPRRSTVLATCAAGLLLLLAAPTPVAAVRALADAGSATDPTGPLVAALALAAWTLALWLGVTVLVTVAGRLPGAVGRACAAVSRRVAPAAVRRAVEVALGLSVAVGVLGASPATAAVTGPAPVAAQPAAATSLDWAAPAPAVPGLDWAGTPQADPPGDLDWPGSRSTAAPGDPVSAAPAAAADETVVVQPGDTLWGLAEQSLQAAGDAAPTDAEVAQAWPSWWSANRDTVGDDPDLLQPGTRLAPPPDADGAGPRSS